MLSIVTVSGTFTDREHRLTANAIKSIKRTVPEAEIINIETHDTNIKHDGAQNIYWTQPFNYNACLNHAYKFCTYDTIAFCNNDLEFQQGWYEPLADALALGDFGSVSPLSRYTGHKHRYKPHTGIHEGYRVGHELLGWCLVMPRSTYITIGGFNEAVEFWYSDNLYADQLQHHGIRHALVTDSIVDHVHGGSLTIFGRGFPRALTFHQKVKYFHARKALR